MKTKTKSQGRRRHEAAAVRMTSLEYERRFADACVKADVVAGPLVRERGASLEGANEICITPRVSVVVGNA